mmetsp:Transcript_1969/g.4725  ORF Transcript_1969/g.4725 Transcript_1969/m.4725 type:complete len:293 (+) Transcript_1969:1241-2119(+)
MIHLRQLPGHWLGLARVRQVLHPGGPDFGIHSVPAPEEALDLRRSLRLPRAHGHQRRSPPQDWLLPSGASRRRHVLAHGRRLLDLRLYHWRPAAWPFGQRVSRERSSTTRGGRQVVGQGHGTGPVQPGARGALCRRRRRESLVGLETGRLRPLHRPSLWRIRAQRRRWPWFLARHEHRARLQQAITLALPVERHRRRWRRRWRGLRHFCGHSRPCAWAGLFRGRRGAGPKRSIARRGVPCPRIRPLLLPGNGLRQRHGTALSRPCRRGHVAGHRLNVRNAPPKGLPQLACSV